MQGRNSAQRTLILSLMEGNGDHPTADEIYTRARLLDSKISRGTVYRNLNLLSEQGIIRKIQIPNAPDHFDSYMHEHCHFHCRVCNRLSDIDMAVDEQFKKVEEGLNRQGFKAVTHDIVFHGICPGCSNKAKERSGNLSEEN